MSEVIRNRVFFFPTSLKEGSKLPFLKIGVFSGSLLSSKERLLAASVPVALASALPCHHGEGLLSRPVSVSPVQTSPIWSLCKSPSSCLTSGPSRSLFTRPESLPRSWDPAGTDGREREERQDGGGGGLVAVC